jgi:CRP-like cAMP-binding protein
MVWAQGAKDEYLFQQGEPGYSFFLIEKGRISV